jgi:hypothetical protein
MRDSHRTHTKPDVFVMVHKGKVILFDQLRDPRCTGKQDDCRAIATSDQGGYANAPQVLL